jgi:hypothetical protein
VSSVEEREGASVDAASSATGGRVGWEVSVTRPDPRVALFEVRLSDYHEYFFVTVGEKSVSITMFDPSDETHLEPQVFTFAKPYGWDLDGDDDDVLLQIWQSVGVQR